MKQLLLVALGGALGAAARWKIGGGILHHTADWRFPLATFAVNLLGCFLAGLLTGLAVRRDLLSADARLFLLTGLMGGFTTFSAFGVESMHLLRRGEQGMALCYILASVVGGVAGVWLGMSCVRGKP